MPIPHRQRILFLNWKDIHNPSAGGAEMLTDALASHMAKTNEVTYITSHFPNAPHSEDIHGYHVIRKGTTLSTIFYAFFIYRRLHIQHPFDRIIDQVHGIPFFSVFYKNHPPIVTFINEVAGRLWGNIIPGNIGLIVDALWLRLYKNQLFFTISISTRQELIASGIPPKSISIVPVFSDLHLPHIPKKTEMRLLVLGRIAPVKRIEHAILAFRILKKTFPTLTLSILGKREKGYESYYQDIRRSIADDLSITLLENIREEEKIHWLKQSRILLMPSQKEGYGIAIVEAAACGAPSVGYNVPGVQDAIRHGVTGLLAPKETPEELARCITPLLNDDILYAKIQQSAFEYSKLYTREETTKIFSQLITSA